MMEILHKAKRKYTGEWVEGYYIKTKESSYILTEIILGEFKEKFQDWVEVDPETVCAYTGKDGEKGKKIWEHDVVSISTYDYMEPAEDFFGEVVYCETWACWCIKEPGAEKPIPLCECEGSYKTEIYVLGNSIDNTEMLEVE